MNENNIYFIKLRSIVIVIYCFSILLSSYSSAVSADGASQAPAQPRVRPPVKTSTLPEQDLWERIRLDLSWQTVEKPQIDSARRELLRQRNYLPAMTARADNYLYYIVEEVQKRDMPIEIAFIPLVESSLNPFASGPSGAAGLWQILPETGIHLGLEQNSRYDGRRSLQDSTTVALDYLETLYKEFDDDWLLAVAAYNSGAGNVTRAREANAAKGLNTDFWSLNLPRHTEEYIPKIIALAQIVADPEHFDVDIPAVENAPAFEVAEPSRPLAMAQAAKLAGVDVSTMRALNPGALGQSVTPNEAGEILVPIGTRNRFETNIAQLTPEEVVQWQTYRIKSGDSLHLIAKRFGDQ